MQDDGVSEPPEDNTEACPHCATLIDITGIRAFSRVHCPSCGGALHVRRHFRNFEIQDIVGQGGMGTVFSALDSTLNRRVALKVLKEEFSNDTESITELAREAKVTASISHPHVVKVYSFGEAYGQYYLAMELVEKGSLDDLMVIQQKVAEAQVLNIGMQIAQGLEAAHAKGLIHSDVKPGNILFADPKTAKIVDFGLAVLQEQQAEEKGEIWGTPYYVPPERLNKEKEDFRSDIYSLGGTLFHALAGRPPFEAENPSLVALKHLKSKAVSLQSFAPDVTSETSYVINRMLEKNVEDRYDSYTELIEHLSYAKEQLMAKVATGQTRRQQITMENDRNTTLVGGLVAIGLVIAFVILGIIIWSNLGDGEERGGRPSATAAAQPRVMSEATVAGIMDQARTEIVNGQYNGAVTTLERVTNPDELRQPLRNWLLTERATAFLLEGNVDKARAIFGILHDEDLYSRDPAQLPLANFFKEIGRLMSADRPVAANVVDLYSGDNYEALALFLFGVKNWRLGEFDDAARLLNAFTASTPADSYEWINEYKPLAESFLTDYKTYVQFKARYERAKNREALEELLADTRAARDELRTGMDLIPSISELEAAIESKIESLGRVVVQRNTPAPARPVAGATPRPTSAATPRPTPTPEPTPDPAVVEREMEAAAAIEALLAEGVAANDLGAAAERLEGFDPETDEGVARKEWIGRKLDWLGEFREILIDDLNEHGYDRPILRKAGPSLEGTVARADADGVEIAVPFGSMPIAWEEIPAAEQVRLSLYFAGRLPDGEPKSRREWIAGIYALESGLRDQARPLLIEAAKAVPALKDDLDRVF